MLKVFLLIAGCVVSLLLLPGIARAQSSGDPSDAPRPTPMGSGGDPRTRRESADRLQDEQDQLNSFDTLVRDKAAMQRYLRDRIAGETGKLIKSNADLGVLTDASVAVPSLKEISRTAARIAKSAKALRAVIGYEAKENKGEGGIDPAVEDQLPQDPLQRRVTEISFLVHDLARHVLPQFVGGQIAIGGAQSDALNKLRRLESLAHELEKLPPSA